MKARTIWKVLPVLVALMLARPVFAFAQASPIADLILPRQNEVLSGIVSIQGTALATDFRFYHLEITADPPTSASRWEAVQPPVAFQVTNSNLGVWDTTFVSDGRYVLRLRVEAGDGSTAEDSVQVTVRNQAPTAVVATATFGLAPGAPPIIEQPPTRTPRPDVTPNSPAGSAFSRALFDLALIQGAACRGVSLTLMAFALLGAYRLLRMALRSGPGSVLDSFRREVWGPLRAGPGRRQKTRKK